MSQNKITKNKPFQHDDLEINLKGQIYIFKN